jgi:hypothetical protein
VGSAAAIERGVKAYAEIGVTDFVAAVPGAQADVENETMQILRGLIRK